MRSEGGRRDGGKWFGSGDDDCVMGKGGNVCMLPPLPSFCVSCGADIDGRTEGATDRADSVNDVVWMEGRKEGAGGTNESAPGYVRCDVCRSPG